MTNEDIAGEFTYRIMNQNNSVSLSPKGQNVPDLWGLIGDADTSDELVEGRGKTIVNWFTYRGINENQIKIIIHEGNFINAINVSGTLTKHETKK